MLKISMFLLPVINSIVNLERNYKEGPKHSRISQLFAFDFSFQSNFLMVHYEPFEQL